jgi:transcriptional regulator GlxA family with amidase domain
MDPKIQRATEFMESHIHLRLSLETIARVAGLSPSRFRHKFKAELGVTPTIYLQTARLKVAKALLASDRLSVKEVKVAVGLQSDSYFTHKFKNRYGYTPSRSRSGENSVSI